MTHTTYVQTIGGGGGYFASCMTCGCDPFPDRATREAAEADARAHGEFRDGSFAPPPMIGYGLGATSLAYGGGLAATGPAFIRDWVR